MQKSSSLVKLHNILGSLGISLTVKYNWSFFPNEIGVNPAQYVTFIGDSVFVRYLLCIKYLKWFYSSSRLIYAKGLPILCSVPKRDKLWLPNSVQVNQCMHWYLNRESGKILRGFHKGGRMSCLVCYAKLHNRMVPHYFLYVLCIIEWYGCPIQHK